MKRCWLHIGMHKTGSTTLQKNLNEIGSFSGWRYVTLGKFNLNEAMIAMFASKPLKNHGLKSSGKSPEEITGLGAAMRTRLERIIRKTVEETIILSAESMEQLDRQGVARLEEFLRPLFDEIRVIGYVRPPSGFVSSSFQEKVKHGKGNFDLSKCVPKYRFRFRKFDKVFGPGRVGLVKFDPDHFTNRCILADFCERTGIALPPGTRVERFNDSLCKQACGILYAYRRFGPGFGVGKRVTKENLTLVRALLAMQGTKFRLSGAVVAPVLAAQADDIRWMENRLGTSLDEHIRQDVGDISSEDDLLAIEPSSLREFARSFGNVIHVPEPELPAMTGDRVNPQAVAAYVQSCREIVVRRSFASSLFSRIRKVIGLSRPIYPLTPP